MWDKMNYLPAWSPMNSLPRANPSVNLRPLADWYLRKGHRRLWFIPLTLGLVALTGVFILRGSMDDPSDNYAQSRAAVQALAPPPVPPEENAWELYKGVFPLMVPYTGNNDFNPFWKTDDDIKHLEAAHVLELWKANAKAIAMLHAAAEKERCNMGMDHVAKPYDMPSLLHQREFANLLALDARCQAHAGNHLAAVKSLRAIRVLAHHLETQPLIIMEMFATALNSIADEAFGAILAFDTPKTVEELQAYKLALEQKRDPFEQMARSMKYETALFLYNTDAMAIGNKGAVNYYSKISGINVHSGLAPLWYGSDRRCFVGVMYAAVESLLKREQPEETSAAIQRHQTGPAIVTRLAAPSYSRALLCFFDIEERSRLAVAATAFLQYRIKHGRDAISMEQLVPEFLPEVPKGFFHDKPIRLTAQRSRKLESSTTMDLVLYKNRPSIRIYTVGRNGIDDVGNSAGYYSEKGEPDDCIFHVPLAKEAGQ